MSNQNIYAAPNACLDIVVDAIPLVRPLQLKIAVGLLWISFFLGIVSSYLSMARDSEVVQGFFMMAIIATSLCVAFILEIVINIAIYRGKNWARILALCFTGISLFFAVYPMEESSLPSATESALNIIDLVLGIFATLLLFTKPCSACFKRLQ